MDPVISLEIAAATAAFLEIGFEIVTAAWKIYQESSGDDVSASEQRLGQLRACLTRVKNRAYPGDPLYKTSMKAIELANEMLLTFSDLSAPSKPSMIGSIKLAIRRRLKESHLERFQSKLEEIKADLSLELLTQLDDRSSSMNVLIQSVEKQMLRLEASATQNISDLRAEVQRMCAAKMTTTESVSALARTVADLSTEVKESETNLRLIDSLAFERMRGREDAVHESHTGTFQWLFEERHDAGQPSDFLSWLRNDSSLFWISGKAGSGKSTLLKFVVQNPKTAEALQSWAGNDKVIISKHFFSSSGTPTQKSIAGLLRSLCYDILCAWPQIAKQACSAKWQALERNPRAQANWTIRELIGLLTQRAIFRSDEAPGIPRCRFCFFIDGLDEYEGLHEDLISTVRKLADAPMVKICLSSRPWNVFQTAFGFLKDVDCTIRVHDLTKDDMATFSRNRLAQHDRWQRMLAENAQGCEKLATAIVAKAEGVFLWVSLVVNELMRSMTNADDWQTLCRRVEAVPPGLERYFQHMFTSLEEFYHKESAWIFRAVLEYQRPPRLITFAALFPADELCIRACKRTTSQMSYQDIVNLQQTLAMRINGRCRDLLEVTGSGSKSPHVEFLHRSVRDFLADEDMTALLQQRSGREFDIDRALCQMALVGTQWSSVLWAEKSVDYRWIGPELEEYGPTENEFTWRFLTSARKLELRQGHLPHEEIKEFETYFASAAQSDDDEVQLAHILAMMHAVSQLRDYLQRTDGRLQDLPFKERCEIVFCAMFYVPVDMLNYFSWEFGSYHDTIRVSDPHRAAFSPRHVREIMELMDFDVNAPVSVGVAADDKDIAEALREPTTMLEKIWMLATTIQSPVRLRGYRNGQLARASDVERRLRLTQSAEERRLLQLTLELVDVGASMDMGVLNYGLVG